MRFRGVQVDLVYAGVCLPWCPTTWSGPQRDRSVLRGLDDLATARSLTASAWPTRSCGLSRTPRRSAPCCGA
ncbi:Os02g0771500 [Oryza sativa Japonica Group]|uniref:Os02g0771500 protein n=2 Tax=Oryza sativa TaxID=4530 RepID=A0A0P0VQ47_ORYSJ|nr:hypothetical protein OsI_09104 [Oryza sativa Indica Group]KAB8089098.1 hypothetical protein EE612_013927 [Oryza sativa]BAS81120.1 Os02g0771500 [Oryza sativa Japonica Group]